MSLFGRSCVGALFGACVVVPLSAQSPPYDGYGNNVDNPTWGATDTWLMRLCPASYDDGMNVPAGMSDRPSPRDISNIVCDQVGSMPSPRRLTSLLVFWGQFVDHDIDLSPDMSPIEFMPIPVPAGDPWLDPGNTGTAIIPFARTNYDPATGLSLDNPRQQTNVISAFIDASNVYGSSESRALALREGVGGRLLVSSGDLLPYNTMGLPNANPFGVPDGQLFAAGDVRCNEQPGLTALHTLFVREHNRLADEFAGANPGWTDEEVFQAARLRVMAILQAITYEQFLPALLGPSAIPAYTGYKPEVDPTIANGFSTAAYRFGHTMINSVIARLNEDGTPLPDGDLLLRDAYFNPLPIATHGISPILRGAADQVAQRYDTRIVTDLRNFLFPAGNGGLDLASVNIMRGRDHGLDTYNQFRIAMGYEPKASFDDVTSDPALVAELEAAYGVIDHLDLWVGGLAEDPAPGSTLGELFTSIVASQYTRLRDGDRFYYENVLSSPEAASIRGTRLADVIRRNTQINDIQDDAFHVRPDLNRDATVNGLDVGLFLQAYFEARSEADFNHNGIINSIDVGLFLNSYSRYR